MNWFKIGAYGAVAVFALALAWFVKHTFEENASLHDDVKALTAQNAQLQKAQDDQAKTLQALSRLYDQHTAAIAQSAKDAANRAAYIAKTYAGASNATKSVLDTDLPEFRCVYDGSCDAATGPVPAAH